MGCNDVPQPLRGFETPWLLGVCCVATVNIFQTIDGHGFLITEYMRDFTKLQDGPLCPPLRVP